MDGLSILLAAAALAVDFGWQPSQQHQGDLDYVIQIEPAVLEQLERGEIVINDIPPDVRGGRRFVLKVGAGQVPREGKPLRQQNVPFGSTGLRTGAGSVPAIVVRQGEPIPLHQPFTPGPAANPAPAAAQPNAPFTPVPGAPAPAPAAPIGGAPQLLNPNAAVPAPGPAVNPVAFPAPAETQPRVAVSAFPAPAAPAPVTPIPPGFAPQPQTIWPATGVQQPAAQPGAAPPWDPIAAPAAPPVGGDFRQPLPAAPGFQAGNPNPPWNDPNVPVASVPRGADPQLNPPLGQPMAPPATNDAWLAGVRDQVPGSPQVPPRVDFEAPRQDFVQPRTDLVAPRTDWNRRDWNDPLRQPGARLDPNFTRVDPRTQPNTPAWDWPPAAQPTDRSAAYPPVPYSPMYDPRLATPVSFNDAGRIGISKVAETVRDAQLTSATAMAATRATPAAPPKVDEKKEQPWTPMLLTALGLFLSIGGNLYLWWIWWDSQRRYLGLIREMRTARV